MTPANMKDIGANAVPAITFTLMTNLAGPNPGKEYWLDEGGELQKEVRGIRLRLKVERKEMSLEAVAELMRVASPECHLVSGVANVPEAIAVSSAILLQHQYRGETYDGNAGLPLIGLSNSDFPRLATPALMLVDSDGEQVAPVMEQLSNAVPGIETYQHICASSSSAFISTVDGKPLNGAKGTHTVFAVVDGTDIARALDDLHKRLFLAGHGQMRLSASGAFLERSAVDRQLRVPSQPIFIRATLQEGLVQSKQVDFIDGIALLDTRTTIPPLTPEEEAQYAVKVADAKLAMLGQATEVRRHYIESRAEQMVARSGEQLTKHAALTVVAKSLQGGALASDFVIYLADNKSVTVGEILADRAAFHGTNCRDPEEPDYGSASVAKIYSDQARPVIHSFAHGGRTFKLQETVDYPPEFDLETMLRQMEADARGRIAEERGDSTLAAWLAANTVSGKTMVPVVDSVTPEDEAIIVQSTADEVAIDMLQLHIGLKEAPPTFNIGGDTPFDAYKGRGLGLRYRLDGQCLHLKLSLNAAEQVLREWMGANRDDCLRGWPAVIAEFGNIESEDDPAFGVIAKFATSQLKLGALKDARETLNRALVDQAVKEAELFSAARPKLRPLPLPERDPEEVEAERVRAKQAEQAALLAGAGDLPQCTNLFERAYETCRTHLGVVGETTIFDATIVSAVSPMLGTKKLVLSLIVNGPSASGKSFTSQAALELLPFDRKFIATSLSDKALFNLPADAVAGKVFVLFEANAMMDPDSPLTMACRTLLTEGRISYHTVEDVMRDDGTVGKQTVQREVSGPTSLITTTTKLFLDPELETRALMLETDDSEHQTRSILKNRIAHIETGVDIERGIPEAELEKWHAYLEWVALQPNQVAIPYWGAIADGATAELVRMRRDIMKLQAVIKIHALLHQNHRERNDHGAVIASIEDYAFARRLVLPTLQREIGGEDVDTGVQEFITGIRKLIDEQKETGRVFNDFPHGSLRLDFDTLNISYTQLSNKLHMHRSGVQRRLQKAIKAGLIENLEERSKKQMRLALVEKKRDLQLLPSPEHVRQMIASNAVSEVQQP